MKTMKATLVVAVICCLFQSAISADLIPRAVLFGNPEKIDPKISPDGTHLAYCAQYEGVLNVWIASRDGDDAVPLTREVRRGIYHYDWAYTNKHILYLQDNDGDENYHIHCVDITNGELRDLTPFPGAKADLLALSPRFPHKAVIAINKDNPALFDIYRVDLIEGTCSLEMKNSGAERNWLADANLVVRARIDIDSEGAQTLFVRDSADALWRPLLIVDPQQDPLIQGGYSSLVGFSADGNYLYLITSINVSTRRLIRMDTQTGSYEEVACDVTYDMASVLFDREQGYPEIAFWEKEKATYMPLVAEIQDDLAFIAAQVPDGTLSSIQKTFDKSIWVVGFNSDVRSYRYCLYHRETRTLRHLFSTRPALDAYTLAPTKPISYATRDGLKIHGYLTSHRTGTQKLPLVLCVHGGPVSRDVWGYNGLAQFFANRGISCLQVNYRGSSGYGKKFVAAGYREWGAKMQDDLVDAVDWAVRKGIADPDKIAIFGGSYGGYAALVGVTFTPELFCCAVDYVGPSNLITLLQSIPSYWSLAQVEKLVGSLSDEEFLRSRSPLFKVDQIRKPVLIAQGAHDPRVKQAESEQIVAAMASKGIPYEYLLFSDEGHGFARPENRLKFFGAVERFFATHMGSLYEKE